MTWLIKEGRVRDVANDQRLFTFTLARIYEKAFFKIGQYNIAKTTSLDVEHPSGKVQHLCICVQDESRHVQVYDEENLSKSLFTFDFQSNYQTAKSLDAFPGLKEKKRQQLMLQFGLVKPDYTKGPAGIDKTATQARPLSAEHSSTKSNNQKKASKLPSGVFNEDLADFERDSEEDIAINKPPTVQKVDEEALA